MLESETKLGRVLGAESKALGTEVRAGGCWGLERSRRGARSRNKAGGARGRSEGRKDARGRNKAWEGAGA